MVIYDEGKPSLTYGSLLSRCVQDGSSRRREASRSGEYIETQLRRFMVIRIHVRTSCCKIRCHLTSNGVQLGVRATAVHRIPRGNLIMPETLFSTDSRRDSALLRPVRLI